MKKGQTSVRDGIEDVLFPMEHCRITQGNIDYVLMIMEG